MQRWESRHGDLRRSCPVTSLPIEGGPKGSMEAGGTQAEAVSGPGSWEMELGGRPPWPVALVVGGGEPGIQASSQGRQRRGQEQGALESGLLGHYHVLPWALCCWRGAPGSAQTPGLGEWLRSSGLFLSLGPLCSAVQSKRENQSARRFVPTAPPCKVSST